MALGALNKPVKGTPEWDKLLNDNFQKIMDYAAATDTQLTDTANKIAANTARIATTKITQITLSNVVKNTEYILLSQDGASKTGFLYITVPNQTLANGESLAETHVPITIKYQNVGSYRRFLVADDLLACGTITNKGDGLTFTATFTIRNTTTNANSNITFEIYAHITSGVMYIKSDSDLATIKADYAYITYN